MKSFAMRSLSLSLVLLATLPFARTYAAEGGGGQEGHGGGDIEAQFGLRAKEIADFFSQNPEAGGDMRGVLSLLDWPEFARVASRTRVVAIDHKPVCLHQDGTSTPRDACFYKATKGQTARIEAYEAGFDRLPPARQRRLVAHEAFRALGMDASDESYELSNAIYVSMPDARGTETSTAASQHNVEALLLSGTYQSADNPCGIKLYRAQAGAGKTVLNATMVQIGNGVGNFCRARNVSIVAKCGPISCLLDFTISHPVETCAQTDKDGYCEMRSIKYEGDRYTYALTPLDDGQLNVLGTATPARGEPDQIVKNQVFSLQGLLRGAKR